MSPEVSSSLLIEMRDFLTQKGISAYLVGGYVRDVLLERKTADIDIAVDADALQTASEVAAAFQGKYVLLDKDNGIARVVLSREEALYLDFSQLRGSIEADLTQRDFTINAMAIDLTQIASPVLQVIDPLGGRRDLERGLVRAVSEGIFQEDAARLLRAVRLAAEFNFRIDISTEALIRQHSPLARRVSGERLREELLRLLAIPKAVNYLRHLDHLGLLTTIIPELSVTKGVEQPTEHIWDVFNHSLETVAAVEFILRESAWQYGYSDLLMVVPWSDTLAEYFSQEVSANSNRKVLIKLAGLLHDIAKPQTKTVEPGGRARFLGHTKEGAVITTSILERLKFSNREISLVGNLVRHHLRPAQISNNELPTRRAIYRYFRDTEEAGIDTLFLSLADYLATRGPFLDMAVWLQHAQIVEYILNEHFRQESVVVPPRLVDGHDLINIFNLNPGPKFGEVLESVHEAQATGELTTREEVLTFIRRRLDLESAQCAEEV